MVHGKPPMQARFRSLILQSLRVHGMVPRPDAISILEDYLSPLSQDQCVKLLSNLVVRLTEALNAKSTKMVDAETVNEVVDAVKSASDGRGRNPGSFVEWIPLSRINRFTYHTTQAQFLKKSPALHVMGNGVESRMAVLRDRYHRVLQRLQRLPVFNTTALPGKEQDTNTLALSAVASVDPNATDSAVVGMVSRTNNHLNPLQIEDLSGSMPIDISGCTQSAGFKTYLLEGGLYLFTGHLSEQGVFLVSGFMVPPPESRREATAVYPGLDFFGNKPAGFQWESLMAAEEKHQGAWVFMLSHVHLDSPEVMARLEKFMSGMKPEKLASVVLCGPFASPDYVHRSNLSGGTHSPSEAYSVLFKGLADLMAKYPNAVAESKWVFVPADSDPPRLRGILPSPPLPKSVTSHVAAVAPLAEFAGNPARIRVFSKELVITTSEVQEQLKRQALISSNTDIEQNGTMCAHTLLGQCHLSPFPLDTAPVHWAHDSGLSLYPAPDVLVLAGGASPAEHEVASTLVLNPGSFSADGTCVAYNVYPGEHVNTADRDHLQHYPSRITRCQIGF